MLMSGLIQFFIYPDFLLDSKTVPWFKARNNNYYKVLLKKAGLLLYLSLCDSVYSLCPDSHRITENFFNRPYFFNHLELSPDL
jgi:hypothetical protein